MNVIQEVQTDGLLGMLSISLIDLSLKVLSDMALSRVMVDIFLEFSEEKFQHPLVLQVLMIHSGEKGLFNPILQMPRLIQCHLNRE